MRPRPSGPDPVAATEAWFLQQGLTYFVPEERHAAREAVRRGRILPLLAVVGLAGAAAGGAVAWVSGQPALAPAIMLTAGLLAAAAYALTALRARPIVGWALSRTFRSLRTMLPMMSRALPLLLLFLTFFFINAEAWELSASLDTGTLWLVVLLFVLLATGFLLVRLPEEVDLADDGVDDAFLLRACAGTPVEQACRELLEDPAADPASHAELAGFERWNLVLVLVVIQAVQVLLVATAVLLFLLLFGGLVMDPEVQAGWTGRDEAELGSLPLLDQLTVPLFQVSLFLAAFSGLYLTVSTMTDEAYRTQFLGSVLQETERAIGVRAVYLALRDRAGRTPQTPG